MFGLNYVFVICNFLQHSKKIIYSFAYNMILFVLIMQKNTVATIRFLSWFKFNLKKLNLLSLCVVNYMFSLHIFPAIIFQLIGFVRCACFHANYKRYSEFALFMFH